MYDFFENDISGAKFNAEFAYVHKIMRFCTAGTILCAFYASVVIWEKTPLVKGVFLRAPKKTPLVKGGKKLSFKGVFQVIPDC